MLQRIGRLVLMDWMGITLNLSAVDGNYDATATTISNSSSTNNLDDSTISSDPLVSDVYEFNGHYYQVVNSQSEVVQNTLTAGTYQEATEAAALRVTMVFKDHLVNITSSEENAFITSLLQADITGLYKDGHQLITDGSSIGASYDGWFYIGGSDRQNEGTYIWENGPEAGELVVYDNWSNGSAESSQKTATGTSDESIDAIAILGVM